MKTASYPLTKPVDATPRRGRFAPSPSGPLHFGSLIAALGSFLEARRQGGEWLVRIEDIDTPRMVPGAADHILRTLERYGMHWDGPVAYQSQRSEPYRAALEQLISIGLAYPCTCSRREVAQRAIPGPTGLIYPGTCRDGVRQPGYAESIRVRTNNLNISFQDGIQGTYAQWLETEVGDFVIRRADGLFAYQLAVVVDDAAQGITDIVRGSDLLASTPRQIYLQRLLGLPIPCYTHLPIAVDRHGAKLGKQTQAAPLDWHHPGPAIVAALHFLNQAPPQELARDHLQAIWAWALENWQPARIPARQTAPSDHDYLEIMSKR